MVILVDKSLTSTAFLLVLVKVKPEIVIEPAIPVPSPMVIVPLLIIPAPSSPVILILEPEAILISLLFKVPTFKV